MPLLLLTTTGAKSGRMITGPLVYTRDGVASSSFFAGGPKHPPWYHNLVANPEATVELGTERFGWAMVTSGEERRLLSPSGTDAHFAEYQQRPPGRYRVQLTRMTEYCARPGLNLHGSLVRHYPRENFFGRYRRSTILSFVRRATATAPCQQEASRRSRSQEPITCWFIVRISRRQRSSGPCW